MSFNNSENNNDCPIGEISAYIDGELSLPDELRLEFHLTNCLECSTELNSQKQFLLALDFSLENSDELPLPANFTRTVVKTAEGRVNGIRGANEGRNALLICSALLLTVIVALGTDIPRLLSGLSIVFDKFIALIGFAAHFLFGIAFGAAVVFRSLAAQFVFGSSFAIVLFLLLFVSSIMVLSRLIYRGSRA